MADWLDQYPLDEGGGTAVAAAPGSATDWLNAYPVEDDGSPELAQRQLLKQQAEAEARQFMQGPFRNTKAVFMGIGGDVDSMIHRPFDSAGADYANWMAAEAERVAQEGDKNNLIVPAMASRIGRNLVRSIIPAIGVGRGQAGAVTYGGLNAANQALTEGADAGLSGLPLAGYAAGQGMIEAGAQTAAGMIPGVSTIAKSLGPGKAAGLVRTAAGEALGEGVTELGQSLLRRTIDEKALDNLPGQVLEAGLAGAAGGAAVGGVGEVAQRYTEGQQRADRLADLKTIRSDAETARVFNDAAWSTGDVAKSTVDQLLADGKTPDQVRELATNPTSSAFESLNLGSRKNRTMPTADARRAFGANALKYLESLNGNRQPTNEQAGGQDVQEASVPPRSGEAAQPQQQAEPAGGVSTTAQANPDDLAAAPGQPAPGIDLTINGQPPGPAQPLTDLLGQPIIDKPKPAPAPEAIPAPKQEQLFDKRGKLGQMNAFDDVGVPEELVAKNPPVSAPTEQNPAETAEEQNPIGRTKDWRKIAEFQAKQWDMTPETYADFARQVWDEQANYLSETDAARKHAQQVTKLYPSDIKRLENAGKDHTAVKGFDVIATDIANNYPALGWQHLAGESSSELEGKLWDLLKRGQQKAPPKWSPEYHQKVDEFLSDLERSVSFNPDEFDNVRAQEDEAERTARRDYAWGFFGGGSNRSRNPGIPPQVKAPNPDVERQLDAAYGVPKPTLMQRLGDLIKSATAAATRSQFHIPSDAKHATMNEMFRLLKQQPASAQDEASRNIAAITGPLAEPQLQLFTRKVITDNLLASVDRGEPLRFGFQDRAEVQAYKDQLDQLAAGSPEVQQALQNRQRIVKSLVGKLQSLDLLPEMTDDQVENYYHQQVLQYQQLAGHSRNPQIMKRGFQRGRTVGPDSFEENLNYNTSYLEAEYEWMRDAYTQAAKEEWLRDVGQRFDTLPQVKAQAKQAGTDWHDELRRSKTHRLWQATPGNVFYRAIGVPEKVVAQVLAGVQQTAQIDATQLRDVLAMGGPQRQMALPNELVDQLDSMKEPKPRGMVGTIASELIKSWKVWTLFNPLRAVAYNLRNITGDLDPVIGGAGFTLPYYGRALKEMAAYHGAVGQQVLSLSPEMKSARDLGVIDATLTASDIPDIKELEIFKRFNTSKANATRLAAGWFNTMKKFSSFRESIARYAAFLAYRDALQKGTLAHYAGARKEIVDAVKQDLGVDAAAAHLSRNLLGDYGDMTVMGDYLRQNVMPFYAWQEVNFKRWPMMAYNAATYGARKFKGNPAAATGASAAAIGMIALPYLLMQVWNRLRYPDEEEDLSDSERASPHIIWGRNSDGSIRILRNTGALGDFLENFGVETALARLDELQAGQMTPQEVAVEMAKGAAAKQINQIRPDIKGAGEAIAGKSLYPDPFNPRPMDRTEIVAGNLGLRDVAAEVEGRVMQTGERARPHFVQRMLGVTDPRQEAFFQILELRDRFLGKLEDKGSFPSNPYFNAMRQAAMADDPDAFKEAHAAYLKDGGTAKKLAERLKNLGPLSRMAKERQAEFINNYLTADQKKKLQMATAYGEDLRVRMWTMLRLSQETGQSVE